MKHSWILLFALGCHPPGKPVAPAANADKNFDKLYALHCAGCHGADGKVGSAPPHNDELFACVVDEAERSKVIREGRAGTAMPAFAHSKGGALTDEQVKVLAEGIPKKWPPKAPNAASEFTYKADGDTGRGKAAFAKACAGCHGANGEGGTFEKQPIGAINNASFLALSSDRFLWRMIVTGRNDLGMPNFQQSIGRAEDFRALTAQEANDITAYLVSWRRKP